MNTPLKESLKNLHANLATSGPVDEELQELLLQLDVDIKRLLEKPPGVEPESTTYGLAERTQEMSARFAAEHPTLEMSLRELGSILANMGI